MKQERFYPVISGEKTRGNATISFRAHKSRVSSKIARAILNLSAPIRCYIERTFSINRRLLRLSRKLGKANMVEAPQQNFWILVIFTWVSLKVRVFDHRWRQDKANVKRLWWLLLPFAVFQNLKCLKKILNLFDIYYSLGLRKSNVHNSYQDPSFISGL